MNLPVRRLSSANNMNQTDNAIATTLVCEYLTKLRGLILELLFFSVSGKRFIVFATCSACSLTISLSSNKF